MHGLLSSELTALLDAAMPEPLPVDYEIESKEATGKWICSICGYVYDPAEHDGVAFEDLPDDWKCPRCRQGKENYNPA